MKSISVKTLVIIFSLQGSMSLASQNNLNSILGDKEEPKTPVAGFTEEECKKMSVQYKIDQNSDEFIDNCISFSVKAAKFAAQRKSSPQDSSYNSLEMQKKRDLSRVPTSLDEKGILPQESEPTHLQVLGESNHEI